MSAPGAGPAFHKLSAGGNDFIVVDALGGEAPGWTELDIRRLCARRLSLGADGVVTLVPSERATARFILHNRDGSAAAFSGNGARCAARVLHLTGRTDDGRCALETDDGVLEARVSSEAGQPAVDIQLPGPDDLRFELPLPEGSPADTGDHARFGVPCLAVPVEDLAGLDLPRVGPPLRYWSELPAGANVSFVGQPADDASVPLRIWERGVEGETLSSGTGCAVAALSHLHRAGTLRQDGAHECELRPPSGIPSLVTVRSRGGEIESVSLRGDARWVASGRLGTEALSGFEPPP